MPRAHSTALRVDPSWTPSPERHVVSKFGGYVPHVPDSKYGQASLTALAQKQASSSKDPPLDSSMYTTSSLAAQEPMRRHLEANAQGLSDGSRRQARHPLNLAIDRSSKAIGAHIAFSMRPADMATNGDEECLDSQRTRLVSSAYSGHRPGDKALFGAGKTLFPPQLPGDTPRTLVPPGTPGSVAPPTASEASFRHPLSSEMRLAPRGTLPMSYSGELYRANTKTNFGASFWRNSDAAAKPAAGQLPATEGIGRTGAARFRANRDMMVASAAHSGDSTLRGGSSSRSSPSSSPSSRSPSSSHSPPSSPPPYNDTDYSA